MPEWLPVAFYSQFRAAMLWIGMLAFTVPGGNSNASESTVSLPTEPSQTSQTDPCLSVDRIYKANEFGAESFSAKWLPPRQSEQDPGNETDAAYTIFEPSKHSDLGRDLVRYDAASGESSVMVSASDLVPPGETEPLRVASYEWSTDQNLLLIFTNTKRVWREHTRGDYWVLDRSSRQLKKLGGDAPPSSLMFAKFSPRGQKVAYVRERNLYVENLDDHRITRLTNSDSEDVIYGTTDWVYEEEFSLRDGFRWNHDGMSIAFWQIDTTHVQKFPLINNTDSLYPTVTKFPYPKVGQRNPVARIGIVETESTQLRWVPLNALSVDPDFAEDFYLPRMQWMPPSAQVGKPSSLLIQQMNRLQNTNRLIASSEQETKLVMVERDDAWVDVHDAIEWVANGNEFTWLSERDGWRHIYLVSRDGDSAPRQVTRGTFDVIELLAIDHAHGWVYYIASPDAPSERYLYRTKLSGGPPQRVTPEDFVGTHQYEFSPDAQFAFHTRSSVNQPPVVELISLPDHEVIRTLVSNEKLQQTIETLDLGTTEFFRVDIGDDVQLEAWCIKPSDFNPKKSYPLLVYVYGEPAGTTVVNRWGGNSGLWHAMMAQHGYVVMSFDNRGTNSPRGRQWRKSIYQQIGILPPKDQALAVRTVLETRPYLDPKRIAIWGWSGGGSSALHAIFKYPEIYQAAIAIAPVPNQRYYDTIYQERYMSLPRLNVEGFRQGSAINFAKQLEGDLLIIHGTGDDNCHYQTTEMLIDELVAHNKPFQMMAYPNRSHSISERKGTTRHLRQLMTRFLLDHVPVHQD